MQLRKTLICRYIIYAKVFFCQQSSPVFFVPKMKNCTSVKLIGLVILLFFILPARAQRTPVLSVKSNPLLTKLRNLRKNNSDTAMDYAHSLIAIANTTGNKNLACEAYLELGRIFFAKDDQVSALQQIKYAESISTPQNDCYYMAPQFIGFILNRQGKSGAALQYLFKALKRVDSAGYTSMQASANFTIADAYRENKYSAKAIGYARKGLEIAALQKDTSQLMVGNTTMGNILSNSDYSNKIRLDSAVKYAQKNMVTPFINKWTGPYDSAKNFLNMGRLYRMQQQFEGAINNLNIAMEVATRRNFKSFEQSILNEIATVELEKGNSKKGLLLAQQAKNILPASQTSMNRVKELVERTQEANVKNGNYKEAYNNVLVADKIKDSIYSLKNQAAIAEIEKRFERDTKVLKATNLAIRKENERNIIVFIAVFFISITSGYFIWRSYQRSKKIEFLSLLIHEVNHRTKNNLQMLSSLIASIYQNIEDDFLKGEIKKLQRYIKSFGLVYDNLNNTASFDDINISKYSQDISTAVFGNLKAAELQFLYSGDTTILVSTDKAILIGLILNELITNSLKYAFSAMGENKISINLVLQKDNLLRIVYSDSGKGYKISDVKKSSFGLHMIRQLVKQLKGSIVLNVLHSQQINLLIPIS